ncbi:DUF2958 domain-containing protein [Sphingopyxis sp. KK2]|uniref:DUF2958 domain-containing protein n=1 Tax=Sphingopyxis sp. KK2 TaxID=1855727 RepID=UPI00097E6E4F|nr:DUF2958 domain-containing protein [Sphingopyxis sp. KK2]
MTLIPANLAFALQANALTSRLRAERDQRFDPWPVVKLYNPVGAATWLATELADDGDTLFGLADLGFGCPELGYFSLAEIREVKLALGLRIERDQHFDPMVALSVWADTARRLGSIIAAETALLNQKRSELPLY